jgi:phosphatidylinositol glycan class K
VDAPTYNDEDIEIDYRGDDVTVDNLVKVLLGRHGNDDTPVLQSDENSHVLVYWTGHGGDSFFKFQDVEEITSPQIARLFQQMYETKRYKELLFIADTCQAFTLGDALTDVPNVYMVGSSLRNENSYAHHSDASLGLSVIERYTHALVKFLEKKNLREVTLKQGLVDHLRYQEQRAHVGYREDMCDRKFHTVPMSDFFANVQSTSMKPLYKENLNELELGSREASPETSTRRALSSDAAKETATCQEAEEQLQRYQGMEPYDPIFITALLVFVGAVALASTLV